MGRPRGCRAYARLVRVYRADPEEWVRASTYGRRSLVESGSSALKRRYGGDLRSRTDARRTSEVYLKVVAYDVQRLQQLCWERR